MFSLNPTFIPVMTSMSTLASTPVPTLTRVTQPSRRAALISIGAGLSLSACGFKLRGQQSYAFNVLYSGFAKGSSVGDEFRRTLESSGNMKVITDNRELDKAQVVLDVLTDQREKTVVGVSATGAVREFQLRLRVKFRLRTVSGKELIAESEILQQRDTNFNESAVLSKEAEEGLLYRDMQSDIVQQILRRLAAVRSL